MSDPLSKMVPIEINHLHEENIMSITTARAHIEDRHVVRDLPDGSQVRARLLADESGQPERGEGMWNEGVSLVRVYDDGVELDEHEGLTKVLNRVYRAEGNEWRVDMVHDPALPATRVDSRPLGDETAARAFIARYLRAFWDVQYAAVHHHTGYAQGNQTDIWVIAEGIEENVSAKNLAEGTFEEWSAWARGDVYGVHVQTRTLVAAMEARWDEDGWVDDEDGGVVWGYYGSENARAAIACELGLSMTDVPPAHTLIPVD